MDCHEVKTGLNYSPNDVIWDTNSEFTENNIDAIPIFKEKIVSIAFKNNGPPIIINHFVSVRLLKLARKRQTELLIGERVLLLNSIVQIMVCIFLSMEIRT